MFAAIGAPLSPVVFASDAQGADDTGEGGDCGGWGLVAADVGEVMARRALLVGLKHNLSVAKLSGD